MQGLEFKSHVLQKYKQIMIHFLKRHLRILFCHHSVHSFEKPGLLATIPHYSLQNSTKKRKSWCLEKGEIGPLSPWPWWNCCQHEEKHGWSAVLRIQKPGSSWTKLGRDSGGPSGLQLTWRKQREWISHLRRLAAKVRIKGKINKMLSGCLQPLHSIFLFLN
jgi:hypothetical protein